MSRSKADTLKNLMHERPSAAQLEQILADLVKQSDRGAALIAGTLVDNLLYLAIECRCIPLTEKLRTDVFEGPLAPLSTFSARIHVGRILGIYGPETQRQLTTIKTVRNAFAHTLHPIDFAHPLIIEECEKLAVAPLEGVRRHRWPPQRERYSRACVDLTRTLLREADRTGGTEIEIHLP